MFSKLFGKKELRSEELKEEYVNFKPRDIRKPTEYFLSLLNTTNENVNRLSVIHEKNTKESNQKGLKVTNFCLSEVLFTYPGTWYSMGKIIDKSWQLFYRQYFSYFINTIDQNYIYNHIMKILSIGILLNIEEIYFAKVSNKLQEVNYSDSFIDYLVNSQYPNHIISENILFPQEIACKTLSDLIHLKGEQACLLINSYLEQYFYTKENLDREFNSHKQNNNIYNGYWAWEVAAVVKIMALDDSSFKDNPYYPYDMVHWEE